jgi:hypothetical protein
MRYLKRMTETTIPNKPNLTLSTQEISDLEFICVVDVLEAGKWVEWEVRFDIDGETFVGFLQGCPRHPHNFHLETIEHCVRY